MGIKKIVTWAIVIFCAYYLVTKPTGAADAMRTVFNLLKSAGSSLATFLNNL
jgi:hypothetical protein